MTHQKKNRSYDTTADANTRFKPRGRVTEDHEDKFLQNIRSAQGRGKRPSEDASHGEPKDSLGGLQPTSPVHEGRGAQQTSVHGKARREECSARVKVARGDDGRNEEEDANPPVDSRARNLIHNGLAQGADECQPISDEVELGYLDTLGQEP